MAHLIRRIDYSREAGALLIAVTGEPETQGPGIRRLFSRGPIWIVARRWVVGSGLVPDRDGRARIRRRGGESELVTRPRAALIPKGHPWRDEPESVR